MLNSTSTGRISKCCQTNMCLFFLGIVAFSSPQLVKAKHNILQRNSCLCKIPNSQLFSYSRKEHTESTCYFYVNRRARIAHSEYRIAYSEYNIPYTVYFYVNAALYMPKCGGNSFEPSEQFLKHQIILEFLLMVLML